MKVKKKFSSELLAATAVSALAMLATPAAAQENGGTPQAADADEAEIVVTGSRRETTLLRAPINISAISADTLEEQRIDDIQKLVRFVPGLAMVDLGPRSPGALVVRGLAVGENSPVNVSNNPVATYLGEVPLFHDFKLLDIERVETLLGPQGTLYGAGTLAGAVRYIPARPNTDRFTIEGHVRAYDLKHAKDPGVIADLVVNIPLVDEKLAFRSMIGRYDLPGFIDSPYVINDPGFSNPQPDLDDPADVAANVHRERDVNDERTWTTRNSLLFRADEDLEVILTYAYQQTKSNGRQSNSAGALRTVLFENGARYLEPMRRSAHLASLELNADIGFAKLTSATAYARQRFRYQRDATDLLLSFEYGYEEFPSFSSLSQSSTDVEQWNQEIRLTSEGDGPLNWVLGGFYNRSKVRSRYFEYVPGYPDFAGIDRPDDLEFASRSYTRTEEKALFGEVGYRLTPEWQITGGVRYFKYDAFVRGGQALPLAGSAPPFPGIEFSDQPGSTSDDGFTYKLNTSYDLGPQATVYATYSTGYRIGGVNQLAPCPDPLPTEGQISCALPNEVYFAPDRTRNVEVGVRAGFLDGKLRTTLALFTIDWRDLQIPGFSQFGSQNITINASRARSRGVEASFNAEPAAGLTLGGTFSYTGAKLTADAPSIVDSEFDAFSGDRLPLTPKYAGSVSASYAHQLADDAEIIFDLGATYRGSTLTSVGARGPGERTDPHTLTQVSLTYKRDNWQFGLFVDNLFDVHKVVGTSDYPNDQGVVNGFEMRRYGRYLTRPRMIGLDFRIRN